MMKTTQKNVCFFLIKRMAGIVQFLFPKRMRYESAWCSNDKTFQKDIRKYNEHLIRYYSRATLSATALSVGILTSLVGAPPSIPVIYIGVSIGAAVGTIGDLIHLADEREKFLLHY